MKKNGKLTPKGIALLAALAVLVCFVAVGCAKEVGILNVPAEDTYTYVNPDGIKAEPDAGFVIDGVLDEEQYQKSNWLKLQNTQGGAGVDVAITSYYGEKGMYIAYDVTESSMIYVNPGRATYLNSCIEMYLASSDVASMSSNRIFEIDMLPTGQLSFRQRTARGNWVNAASTGDIMATLGATTKGGPVNTEECTGYYLELFIPWEYMEKLGLDASKMKQDFIYINPVHITSYNYEGTNSGTDRYWYSFATQLGGNGWGDVSQYFRFGANGVLGTVPMELVQGDNYTIAGNDSVIPGMLTTVQLTPAEGYALSSILVNGEEYIDQVAYNKDGSVTLELRGQKQGLKISAAAEAVTEGNKTLSGTVQVHKLGGDTLEGVSASYKGPTGEKPLTLDAEGRFTLEGLEQGYYTITVEKKGYAPINRGIYLNRDVDTMLVLEYQTLETESGYNWILDDQNDGKLSRFGGSGNVLSVDSYDTFAVEAMFRYDTELAEMSDGDSFEQQRAGIQIKFSNGKVWRVDLLKQNDAYRVQYAKSGESSLFDWKTVHKLTEEEIAQYQSEEGIKLSVLREGNIAWVCLNDRPVAIEVLDAEYKDYTAQVGFEGWVANQEIEEMEYNIYEDLNRNLMYFNFTTNTSWDISRQLQGILTLPGGGNGSIPLYYRYIDFDFVFTNVKEHDYTGSKPGRTDLLLEFDTDGNGSVDKSVSFGIVCTNREKKTCWVQTLGNANNHIPAVRVNGLYKLSAEEAEKYLNGYGVELRVVRKGTEVYIFVDGEEVAIWDLTQNNSGVTADTLVKLSVRHYDAKGDVVLGYGVTGSVEDVEIDKIFKDNDNWDLSKQLEGVVTLPGGGTETTLQFFKKYQKIDLTVTARENDTTGSKPGRTDVLFEFDLDNDGTWDKNVSFGVVQLSGGRCAIQTLGWNKNFIPEARITELYELDYAETLKYKGDGIPFRVVRYGTNVYLYLEDKQVAVFDLTQNNSGVQAETKATVLLRHYDAVADEVVIPFTVTDQVTEPEIQEQPKQIFKKNHKWDLSKQNMGTVTVDGIEKIQGIASLPGGGTNTVVFYDQYADLDLTITAKENKSAKAKNGGRTDVLFEFDTNGDGKVDKSVSFGIVKWSAASSCVVETLGNSNNFIPAVRKNTLYTLNDAETSRYLDSGVELRLIRIGTNVYVLLEGKVVSVFDLTQNNSGVTADMKATVSLRHYDAVTDQVDIPFAITDELARVTVTDSSVNGAVVLQNEDCVVGAEVILSGKANEGYYLTGLKVDGVEVTLNTDGTYRFTATKSSYTVEGTFTRKVFKDNAKWDLSRQNLGTVAVDGVEKIHGIASLPGGGTNAVAFYDPYTDLDLTVTAKEYGTTKAGRTDILFEFENGKNVSFGIIKTSSGCWVQTLGISKNYIPSTRVNALYKLSDAEAAKYLTGDGVELRVIRKGVNVHVLVEGNVVHTFDLTQNNSGVTAHMKATVSLRHYDAVADQVDIPFAITGKLATVTITDNSANGAMVADKDSYVIGDEVVLTGKAEGYNLTAMKVDGAYVALSADGTYRFVAAKTNYSVECIFSVPIFESGYDSALWDLSGQYDGYVTVIGGGGSTAQALQFNGQYQNIDLTVNARDYADSSTASRTDVGFEFDVDGDGVIDHSVTFGIAQGNRVQTRGGTLLSWQTPYYLTDAEKAQLVIDADEIASGNEDGLDLRIVRYGTGIYIFVENKQVAFCDLTKCANANGDTESGITADTRMIVKLRHYDDKRTDGVQIPFTLKTYVTPVPISIASNDMGTVTTNKVSYYVNNVKTEKSGDTHFAGETVILTMSPARETCYVKKVTVNGTDVTANIIVNADGTAVYVLNTATAEYTVNVEFDEPFVYGTGYVPVKGQQVKTTASFATFPRTIEVTFNRSDLTNRSILIGSCDGKTTDYINLEAPVNESIIYLNMTLNGTTYRHSFNRVSVPAGETFRVTVVIEDEAVKCYVNGVLAQTRTASNGSDGSKSISALLTSAASAKLPVGYGFGDDLRNGDAHYFRGTIYAVALWSDARTAEEVAAGIDYQDENLLAAYNFTAGYRVSAVNPFHTDLSGNGFTLSGTLNVGTSSTPIAHP